MTDKRDSEAVWRASERVLAGSHPRRWDEDGDRACTACTRGCSATGTG